MSKKEKVVAVSGGFAPLHVGHISLFEEARALGDKLVVILNNDNWLKKKKGYVFMNEEERKEVLLALEAVDEVVVTNHPEDPGDMSVCRELEKLRPDIFANGGDRKERGEFEDQGGVPEYKVCDRLGIEMRFGIGGDKVQSSTRLVRGVVEEINGGN